VTEDKAVPKPAKPNMANPSTPGVQKPTNRPGGKAEPPPERKES